MQARLVSRCQGMCCMSRLEKGRDGLMASPFQAEASCIWG